MLHAQEEDVTMKIDFVAWGNTIPGLSLKPNDKDGAITAEAFRYTTPINYKGKQLMEIHQDTNIKVEDIKISDEDKLHESKPFIESAQTEEEAAPQTALGKKLMELKKEKPTLVALVPLPTSSHCTVLLAPIGKGLYQGYVLEDDPNKLPAANVRITNLSPHHISMQCNALNAKELKPRESFIVPAKGGGIVYLLSYLENKKWVKQENNMLAVKPNEQVQLIILQSENQFFLSGDGSRSGFLQAVRLIRKL